MFERFTPEARQAVAAAQASARELRHNYIGTEHLLLGILGVAAEPAAILAAHGVTPEAARERVAALVPSGSDDAPRGQAPFTPRAKKVLELALREAKELNCNYIAAGHILLGLIREGDGVGARVLRELAGDLDALRSAVVAGMPAAVPKVRRLPTAGGHVDPGTFLISSSAEVRRLMMAAAAHALSDGRTEIAVADVRSALRASDAPEEPPEAQAL